MFLGANLTMPLLHRGVYQKIGGNVHWNRIPSGKNSSTGSLEPLDLRRPHLINIAALVGGPISSNTRVPGS